MARGTIVIKNIILQFIKKMQMRAIIIWPNAHPIESAIGEEVLNTFSET